MGVCVCAEKGGGGYESIRPAGPAPTMRTSVVCGVGEVMGGVGACCGDGESWLVRYEVCCMWYLNVSK